MVERGIPRFTRVSSMAGNQFTQAIANVMNLTFDEAEQLKIRAGLPDIDSMQTAPADADEQSIRVAQEALERETNKFIAEVRRSLDYYLTQATQVRTIKRVYLTGTGSELRNLASYLEKGLQTEVVLGDPLAQITASGAAAEAVAADRMGSAAAIGLALWGCLVAMVRINLLPPGYSRSTLREVVRRRVPGVRRASRHHPSRIRVLLAGWRAEERRPPVAAGAVEQAAGAGRRVRHLRAEGGRLGVKRQAVATTALANRVSMGRVGEEVSLVLPDEVWLQQLSISEVDGTPPSPAIRRTRRAIRWT